MSYCLAIHSSPNGADSSASKKLAVAFLTEFKAKHEGVEVIEKDLSANPVPHLDVEGMNASYVPEDSRPPSMQDKLKLRLDLISELTTASSVVISLPMWNWGIPSSLKAYIDQIVLPGVLDPYHFKGLTGKPITFLVACGGEYSSEDKKAIDFVSGYLTHVATSLGATDIVVIRTELTLAGIVPGMESLVEAKEASFAKASEAAIARAGSI